MTGTVISNTKILPGAQLYDLRFELPEAATSALPGQFVHISCGPGFTLRRPISICEAGDGALRVCYDVRGKGTAYLSALVPGNTIDILPPTGHGFKVRESGRALLVGGGIGIYPLLWCAKLYGSRCDTALGFRTPELVNLDGEFAEHCASVEVITDDRGFVTSLVESALKRAESNGSQYAVVHTCGPKAMMRRVADTAEKFGVDCEVSMEERMACGVGACMGCVCKTRDGDGWTNKRVCVDGPVFDSREVIWQ
jgi:2-polyprenylphenol hydroxylase and related flavodoxin oxidoreductases